MSTLLNGDQIITIVNLTDSASSVTNADSVLSPTALAITRVCSQFAAHMTPPIISDNSCADVPLVVSLSTAPNISIVVPIMRVRSVDLETPEVVSVHDALVTQCVDINANTANQLKLTINTDANSCVSTDFILATVCHTPLPSCRSHNSKIPIVSPKHDISTDVVAAINSEICMNLTCVNDVSPIGPVVYEDERESGGYASDDDKDNRHYNYSDNSIHSEMDGIEVWRV